MIKLKLLNFRGQEPNDRRKYILLKRLSNNNKVNFRSACLNAQEPLNFICRIINNSLCWSSLLSAAGLLKYVTFLLPPAMKGLIVESIEYRSNFQLQKNRHSLKRIFVAKRFLLLLLLLICLHIHLISHMRKQTLTKNDFFFAIKNLFCSLVYTC